MSDLTTVDDRARTAFRCGEFVLAEADLLDERRFDAWTRLFTDDAVYWAPMNPAQPTPGAGLNIIYDDKARLLDRVARLESGLAFSEEPHSVTSHLVSGVRVLDPEQAAAVAGGRAVAADEHVVSARCAIGRLRHERTQTFHARVVWILREAGDTYRIALKRVDLLDAHAPVPVLTFLL